MPGEALLHRLSMSPQHVVAASIGFQHLQANPQLFAVAPCALCASACRYERHLTFMQGELRAAVSLIYAFRLGVQKLTWSTVIARPA